ncbi:MAG: hypothetical protein QW179_01570 [Candidatus Hadarchaeales archaeon]
MEDEREDAWKICGRCGMKGFYLVNGICLDCLEAEIRSTAISHNLQDSFQNHLETFERRLTNGGEKS